MRNRKLLFLIAMFIVANTASANVRLPQIFGDGMVLQRNQPIAVWGWADPDEQIVVFLNHQTKSTTADENGNWSLKLAPEQAGGPYELQVSGNNVLRFKDVLLGEVWLCSGQSNMELEMKYLLHAGPEIASSNNPNIRQIKIPIAVSSQLENDVAGSPEWKAVQPGNTAEFTAVGYFFAMDLYKKLGVPIGLINASRGATTIEPWIAKSAFQTMPELKEIVDQIPLININDLNKERRQFIESRIGKIQNAIPNPINVVQWKSSDFDDHAWPFMLIPGFWEQKMLKGLDGVVWFRKEIEIDDSIDAADKIVLKVGYIDDNDQIYLNGITIGASNGALKQRIYSVPPGILRAGKNVLAIRVEDIGGNGGFAGSPDDFELIYGDKKMVLAGNWKYQVAEMYDSSWKVEPNTFPSLLFNTMINPLVPYTMRGTIWYQGEGNAGGATRYRKTFPLLITDWRKRWGNGDFPFYFVQLSSFNSTGKVSDSNIGSAWAELREAQASVLNLPNTGMAVTTDIGDAENIHPQNKQDVGKRLAALALSGTYGIKTVHKGPVYKDFKIKQDKIIISFDEVQGGLCTKDSSPSVMGFELAGADRKFVSAVAKISGNTVIVHHEHIKAPIIVRYSWTDDAGKSNLFNKEGFPAAPFRTDKD